MNIHSEPHHSREQHERGIDLCLTCSRICCETLFGHCLNMGGAHLDKEHVGLMTDCIALCHVAADFMVRGSPHHVRTCGLCAEVCHLCAQSCRRLADMHMDRCADVCEQCASACAEMASQPMPG